MPGSPVVHFTLPGRRSPRPAGAAKITRLGGRVDPVSQTIKVFGEIGGAAPELMAGMSGRANIAAPN
jgi:hypothetical protein